jgi:hypothetical protein
MLSILMVLVGVFLILPTVIGLVSMSFNSSVGGAITLNQNVTVTDNFGVQTNPTPIAAQPGTLTTHTTNTTGTLTMTNANHGITTGQRIDIFWSGGQCYGAVVGTVAGTTVPIASVSGGSNLPAQGTAVTVGIPISAPFSLTGNNLTGLALFMPSGQNGYIVFNNGSSDVYAAYLTGGYISTWKSGDPQSNPLAGAVPTVCWMSHSDVNGPVTGITAAAVAH